MRNIFIQTIKVWNSQQNIEWTYNGRVHLIRIVKSLVQKWEEGGFPSPHLKCEPIFALFWAF